MRTSRWKTPSELVGLLRGKEHYDGFVVTQGTDTLEETAYVVDLLWDRPAPVVVTGAMRNPTVPGSRRAGEPAGSHRGGRQRHREISRLPGGPRR